MTQLRFARGISVKLSSSAKLAPIPIISPLWSIGKLDAINFPDTNNQSHCEAAGATPPPHGAAALPNFDFPRKLILHSTAMDQYPEQIPGLGGHSQEGGTPDTPDIIPGLSRYSQRRITCSPTLKEIWRTEMLISEEELRHAIGVLLEQRTEELKPFYASQNTSSTWFYPTHPTLDTFIMLNLVKCDVKWSKLP
ncbi:hypothetical protein B0H14DRAFT_3142527 [Mycena olivaceomarginata]|nr:hypothetical protein B0H14DRAFT_3142527 [Mycena olivaceomarginata]